MSTTSDSRNPSGVPGRPQRSVSAASPELPEASLTMQSSRRFWLWALGIVVVLVAGVQIYGYTTGWGDPRRVVQRQFNDAQKLSLAGRPEAAIRVYQKIADRKTDDESLRQALIGMADLYLQERDFPNAIDAYSRLRSQSQDTVLDAWAGLKIAESRLASGDVQAAHEGYADIARRFPDTDWDAEAQLGLGAVLAKQEKYPEAIARLTGLAKRYEGGFIAAEALLRIGDCYREQGDREAARRTYQEVVDHYPGMNDDAKKRLARLDQSQQPEGIRVWGQ